MNNFKFSVFVSIAFLASCAVSKDPQRKEIKLLQKGKIKEDTSYIYTLPYQKGSSHFLIQGYYGAFSHKHRTALDFKMPRGTKIVGARDGVVIRAREDNNQGGWSRKFRKYGNYIVVEHFDGTRAGYWHLKQNGVLVNVGDTVKQGQVIGLSGRTGYAFLPHLHFTVSTNNNGRWKQVPTRFLTARGARYLKPFRRYCSK